MEPISRLAMTFVRIAALLVLLPSLSAAQITIVLNNSFIEANKNRVTLDAAFTVDKAHKSPNPPSKDGDMHVAGRAPEIGLPTVAELMNATLLAGPQVKTIKSAEGSGKPIGVTGVWRIWCEHAGAEDQIQGAPLDPFTSTNPDHVFELHPLTAVDGAPVVKTLVPIEGFANKEANAAFSAYEAVRLEIKREGTKTRLFTHGVGFNYVEFILRPEETQHLEVEDGRFVRSSVFDKEGELIARNRRMVFVKDSGPEQMLKTLKPGQGMRVLGIPRVNLAVLSWRIRNAASRPEVARWNLPYEIVVVGAYEIVSEDDLPES